jgi:hypothetical protein
VPYFTRLEATSVVFHVIVVELLVGAVFETLLITGPVVSTVKFTVVCPVIPAESLANTVTLCDPSEEIERLALR